MRGLLILLCAGYALAQYEGHQLLQLYPKTEAQSLMLRDLQLNDVELDFWTEPNRIGEPVDVLVPPQRLAKFLLELSGIDYITRDSNIQLVVDEERQRLDKQDKNRPVDLDDWNDFETIMEWVDNLPGRCGGGVSCEVSDIGTTEGGRRIALFSMVTDASNPAFWIDATIHAREWLATGTILKIIDNFVQGNDGDANRFLSNFNVYFVPVMNPDGYAYTHSNERLWRKNRATNAGSGCLGTDLNRNYDWRWGTEGVSTNPCSDLFCGSSGGSEAETQAIQNEAARLAGGSDIPAWITIHSYGRMWMHPWGNTVNGAGQTCQRATDHDIMYRLAVLVADEIEANGNSGNWARGTSCEVIYETTGATDDYMKGTHAVNHPICPELRGNSFIVDANQIEPSFVEIWAGLVVMADDLA